MTKFFATVGFLTSVVVAICVWDTREHLKAHMRNFDSQARRETDGKVLLGTAFGRPVYGPAENDNAEDATKSSEVIAKISAYRPRVYPALEPTKVITRFVNNPPQLRETMWLQDVIGVYFLNQDIEFHASPDDEPNSYDLGLIISEDVNPNRSAISIDAMKSYSQTPTIVWRGTIEWYSDLGHIEFDKLALLVMEQFGDDLDDLEIGRETLTGLNFDQLTVVADIHKYNTEIEYTTEFTRPDEGEKDLN